MLGDMPPAVARGAFYDGQSSSTQEKAKPATENSADQQLDPESAFNQRAAEVYGDFRDEDGNPLSADQVVARAVPDNIRQARAQVEGGAMFGGPTDTAEVRGEFGKLLDMGEGATVPTDLKRAVAAEYARCCGDLGLDASESVAVVSAARQAFENGAVDAEQVAKWDYTSRNISKEYRPEVIAKARELVRQDPRIFNLVNSTGYIGHPRFVRAMLNAADRQLKGGRK